MNIPCHGPCCSELNEDNKRRKLQEDVILKMTCGCGYSFESIGEFNQHISEEKSESCKLKKKTFDAVKFNNERLKLNFQEFFTTRKKVVETAAHVSNIGLGGCTHNSATGCLKKNAL